VLAEPEKPRVDRARLREGARRRRLGGCAPEVNRCSLEHARRLEVERERLGALGNERLHGDRELTVQLARGVRVHGLVNDVTDAVVVGHDGLVVVEGD
jgi:hypothetical protein